MSDNIQERIQIDMLSSLKGGNRSRKDVLSYLLSELQAASKAKQSAELTDIEAIALLQRQSNKVQETLEAAQKGGRADAVAQSTFELEIIQEFLPAAPPADVVADVARQVISDLGATSIRDMGRVMAEVPNRLPGADKATVSTVVMRLLTSA